MCGIIGYIGKHNALPILISGLKKLEYRGYDSSGVAVIKCKANIQVFKAVGRISELEKKIAKEKITGQAGIAHTRWATHGFPTEKNSHPHCDCAGAIWLAHNGIIENYRQLKNKLIKKGHKFCSQTDTEVIAHLIEENYRGDLCAAIQKSLPQLKGAYGLAIIHKDHPDMIIAAKMGSPLVLGIGKNETIITSDPASVLSRTKKVIYLNDGEIAEVRASGMRIINKSNELVKQEIEELNWDFSQAEKGDFPDFMLKEIFEQPETTKQTMAGRLKGNQVKLGGVEDAKEKLKQIEKIYIIGCGTARFAGLAGEYLLEEYGGVEVEADYASEFRYREMNFNKRRTAVLAISQSGETADTIAALDKAKKAGLLTLGVVNIVGSTIARMTDAGIYTHSGPEIAVASTKALTSQITVLALLAVYLGKLKGTAPAKLNVLAAELQKLPRKMEEVLKESENIKKIAKKYAACRDFAFLGRKYNQPIAFEGALKLKELSYVHAEGFPAGELKHGPIAMIDENFPCVFIAPRDSVYEKNLSNMEEVKARKGKVIAVATKGDTRIKKIADDVIYIPKTTEALSPLPAIIALQLFAYHFSIINGRDVDKPRNLAKSVTVE